MLVRSSHKKWYSPFYNNRSRPSQQWQLTSCSTKRQDIKTGTKPEKRGLLFGSILIQISDSYLENMYEKSQTFIGFVKSALKSLCSGTSRVKYVAEPSQYGRVV